MRQVRQWNAGLNTSALVIFAAPDRKCPTQQQRALTHTEQTVRHRLDLRVFRQSDAIIDNAQYQRTVIALERDANVARLRILDDVCQ
jgi:hypothetical protein